MSTGKLVSIVNNDNTRYEGILHSVDQATQTIQLTDVQAFGTETRPATQFIPPYPSQYPQITFQRGSIAQLTTLNERTLIVEPKPIQTTTSTSTDSANSSTDSKSNINNPDDEAFNSKTLDIDHSKPFVSTYSKDGFFDKTNRRAGALQFNNVATFGSQLPGRRRNNNTNTNNTNNTNNNANNNNGPYNDRNNNNNGGNSNNYNNNNNNTRRNFNNNNNSPNNYRKDNNNDGGNYKNYNNNNNNNDRYTNNNNNDRYNNNNNNNNRPNNNGGGGNYNRNFNNGNSTNLE